MQLSGPLSGSFFLDIIMIILFKRHKSRFLESVHVMDDLKNGDTWKKSNREKRRRL